jgi:two-component system OmpR family sensor kinase
VSLRTRLLLAVGVVALIALIVADVATYSSLRSFLYSRVDQSLQTAAASLPPGPGFGPGPGGGDDGRGPVYAPGLSVAWRSNGVLQSSSPAYEPGGRAYSPHLPAGTLAADDKRPGQYFFSTPSTTENGPTFRVLVVTGADGDQLIVGQPLDSTEATLHRLLAIELAVTAGALLAAVLLGLWLVRVGLTPLREVEDTAEAIAEGQLDRRVPGDDRRTEVGRLARVLNTMLARIERAFAERDATEAALRQSEERMRRFVADASHELRTPLAAVTAYAELYGRGASERPEDLDRVMTGISSESARMKSLVDDLLLLARLDEHRPLDVRPVELVALAADAVQAATAVGPQWPVTLEAAQPVELSGDAERLRQVLDNLLANVRAHTPAGTHTVVRVVPERDVALLEVSDDGPGLSDADAARVFERFYRSDPSRSRQSGGAGLGLSIVAAIVAAHGGTVAAAPRPGGGTTFTIRLPIAQVRAGIAVPIADGGREEDDARGSHDRPSTEVGPPGPGQENVAAPVSAASGGSPPEATP